ncbi:MAG: glycerol-3-phosphate dehydrogenase/oxidase [Candidatus Omnitrophica bacterium]|nr:glycerol-3-phosphate dehydrogenase/oxidase [Candidatus Omnitrophota bacterium]
MGRDAFLRQLSSRQFEVLIIGGGIVGAGIARDAAMRGLKAALVEQGDFGSGTSSKTSKLIHGGLRYLEQGRLRLVFESLRERAILRRIAAGSVHPRSLLLPVYEGDARPAWKIHAGLWLYDLLAVGRNLPACADGAAGRRTHRWLSARRALALEPSLRVDGLRAAGLYADCQMDDARVCLANVLQAAGFGAVVGNYLRVRTLLSADGQVCGALVEDVLTGRMVEIHARVVVNATGPWADDLRRLSDPDAPRRLAPTKGIHLILPRLAQEALFVQSRADGRMLFILPWDGYSLVGTTESSVHESPEALRPEPDEVGYLLAEVNRVLPGSHAADRDVIAAFAGARPLLAHAGSAATASREHRIEIDRRGLVSVMGGKFTTYRLMAEQTVDLLVRRHRWKEERCLTDQVSLMEDVQPVSLERWHALVQAIDPDLLARWLVRYGAGTFRLLDALDHDPSLAQPVCPHHEYAQAELVHAIRHELACTLTDVLARRTRIAWSPCHGLDALPVVIGLFQRYGGTLAQPMEQQVEAYHQFLAQHRGSRRPHPVAAAATVSS